MENGKRLKNVHEMMFQNYNGVRYYLIRNLEFYYAISLVGDVISLPKVVSERMSNVKRKLKARRLTQYLPNNGKRDELFVNLNINGSVTRRTIISLLSDTFEISIIDGYICIFLDGNVNNRAIHNLSFISNFNNHNTRVGNCGYDPSAV